MRRKGGTQASSSFMMIDRACRAKKVAVRGNLTRRQIVLGRNGCPALRYNAVLEMSTSPQVGSWLWYVRVVVAADTEAHSLTTPKLSRDFFLAPTSSISCAQGQDEWQGDNQEESDRHAGCDKYNYQSAGHFDWHDDRARLVSTAQFAEYLYFRGRGGRE